jgi:hypothetical protein
MLTPDQLRAMTPEQRTALFEKMCAEHYGDRLTAVLVAADFDVRRETYFRWRKDHTVPFAALYALDGWLNSVDRAEKIIAKWGTIPADMAEAANAMARAAGTMAKIAKLSAPASGDTEGA